MLLRQTAGYRPVIIVAMTVHSMKGDREICLDAGMDDYISKPIEAEKMISILESTVAYRAPWTFLCTEIKTKRQRR